MQNLTKINRIKLATALATSLFLAAQFVPIEPARGEQTPALSFAPQFAATGTAFGQQPDASPFGAQFAEAESSSSQQAAALPPTPSKWASVASLDLTLTRGNSRNFLATTTINSTRKTAENELLLGASAGYGDTTTTIAGQGNVTTKTQDYLKGFAQENHLFTDRSYGGLRVEGLHDDIAGIDYRLTISPLVGYYILKCTNTFVTAEAGPSYINERLNDHTDSYAAARLAQRFQYKFSAGAKLWENVEWLPQVDRFGNWILNAEAGISAPINKSLDVRLVADDSYNNQPASGLLKNDLKLMAGIGYKF